MIALKNSGNLEKRKEEEPGIVLADSGLFSQVTDKNGEQRTKSWLCCQKVICLLP